MKNVVNVTTNFEHNVLDCGQLVGSAMVTVDVLMDHAPHRIRKNECIKIDRICITSTNDREAVVLCYLKGDARFSFNLVWSPSDLSNNWFTSMPLDAVYRSYLSAANECIANRGE